MRGQTFLDEPDTSRQQCNDAVYADIGYGNYILTAPAERTSRDVKHSREKRRDAAEEDDADDGVYDVPELLDPSNTLTNPDNHRERRTRRRAEL